MEDKKLTEIEEQIQKLANDAYRQLRNAVAVDVLLKLIEKNDNPFSAAGTLARCSFEIADAFMLRAELDPK